MAHINRITGMRNVTVAANGVNSARQTAKTFRAETEDVLRDMAYVLQLSRRVKDEIMADRAEAAQGW